MQDKGSASVPIRVLPSEDVDSWLAQLNGNSRRWVQANGFTAGKAGHCLIPGSEGELEQIVCAIEDDPNTWSIAQLARQLPPGNYHLTEDFDAQTRRKLALGFLLASYQFGRYRKAKNNWPTLSTGNKDDDATIRVTGRAAFLVRDLVNTPAQDLGPVQLGESLHSLADEFGGSFEKVVGAELLEQNFPAIHAVGRAAEQLPSLLKLHWGDDGDPLVILVGKGVCFDSGGLDIKSATGMRLMKKDMGGAAHAMGVARLIMEQRLPIQIKVLIPAVENAIAGNAYRPGDVISTRAGLSVEIGNTDAEGRVVLADALKLASEFRPELIVDFATLTGAARIALGPDLPPLFCNRDELAQDLLAASNAVDDPLWRMPLHHNYNKMIKGNVADLCNVADSPMGGCITAALFLEHFVDPDIPWCHIDTFAWNPNSQPGRPKGGEAQGMRGVFEYLRRRYS